MAENKKKGVSKAAINIELRGEILTCSLQIESLVGILFKDQFTIAAKKPKFFDAKLDFQVKLNILLDSEIITSDEVKPIMLVMELRNKFMHDISCDSFGKALDMLSDDKRKFFNSFNEGVKKGQMKDEEFYLVIFNKLFDKCWEILMDVFARNLITKPNANISEGMELLVKYMDYPNARMKAFEVTILDILRYSHEAKDTDPAKILRRKIDNRLKELSTYLNTDEEFLAKQDDFSKVMDIEILRNFLDRIPRRKKGTTQNDKKQ